VAGKVKSIALIDMLFEFGISKGEYNSIMSRANSIAQASNYFEGIKIRVSMAWDDMKDRVKPDQKTRLQASHDRIQRLKLSNWTKPVQPCDNINTQIQRSMERIVDGNGSEEDYKLARCALGICGHN